MNSEKTKCNPLTKFTFISKISLDKTLLNEKTSNTIVMFHPQQTQTSTTPTRIYKITTPIQHIRG